MNSAARQLIAQLALAPLPGEGGFFRQTSCSATSSAIYFLLTTEDFSALHRLAQEEIWHFYAGDPVEHVQLDPHDGSARIVRLGANVLGGDTPQVRVPPRVWQGARLPLADPRGRDHPALAHGWSLMGCTVSPPWDERQFELASRAALRAQFPGHAAWIQALTR